jgi:hypothetical protein
MAFLGQIFQIGLSGAFDANENLGQVAPGNFTDGSRNILTHNGGAEKRGGTAQVNSPAITGTPECLGGGQLIKQSTGTSYIYFAGDDGKVWRDYTSAILTGRSVSAKTHFTAMEDKMFICNGVDGVQVDTGSSVAAITTAATDWTGSAQPTKMVAHGRGQSKRAFAWGVPGKETTLYYSSQGDFEEFNGGTSGTVVIDVKDGFGIIDCISIDENLLIRTRNQDYWLDDSDPTIANWGYFKTGWQGGVHSPRLSVHIYNDVYTMASDGEIYTIARAEQLRDYKRASIARPWFIHNWITNNVDLTRIDNFHMSFDPRIQAVRIWVIRQGQTQCDTNLVYYINEGKWAPPQDAQDNRDDSGHEAAASFPVIVSTGDEALYTGDYSGFVWEIEDATKSDNANAYTSIALTGWLDLGLAGIEKRVKYGVLHFISRGDYDIDIRWWTDGVEQNTQTVTLGASGATLGSFLLGTDVLSVLELTKQEFELGDSGERFRFQLTNDQAGEDFFLSHVLIPFLSRGHRRL